MHRYNIQATKMEKIMPRRFHVDRKPCHTTQIITDRKLAIKSIARNDPDFKIYTDGSEINDKIRASTVLY